MTMNSNPIPCTCIRDSAIVLRRSLDELVKLGYMTDAYIDAGVATLDHAINFLAVFAMHGTDPMSNAMQTSTQIIERMASLFINDPHPPDQMM